MCHSRTFDTVCYLKKGKKVDKELLLNLDKINTTNMGINRIKKNLKIETEDVVKYCKNLILDRRSIIYKKGKNYYCKNNNIIITINSESYTIITAHIF